VDNYDASVMIRPTARARIFNFVQDRTWRSHVNWYGDALQFLTTWRCIHTTEWCRSPQMIYRRLAG